MWHKFLGHASLKTFSKLFKLDLVNGLTKCKFELDHLCEACAKGKIVRSSFKSKENVSTSGILELLHMDLCGPMSTRSRGGKFYVFVIVDDYSRFMWVYFLRENYDTLNKFIELYNLVPVSKENRI